MWRDFFPNMRHIQSRSCMEDFVSAAQKIQKIIANKLVQVEKETCIFIHIRKK